METYKLQIDLKSDTCFSRGDGVAGYVDTEIKHDRYGMPYVDGRTIKGLLASACAEILDAVRMSGSASYEEVYAMAEKLFGAPGSGGEKAKLRIGRASLPEDLRQAIKKEFPPQMDREAFQTLKREYLDAFTVIRRQTAMDESGAPKAESLRAIRLLRSGLIFEALLECEKTLTEVERGLLAVCARVFQRAGSSRNRGSGRVETRLLGASGKDVSTDQAKRFVQEVLA